MADPKMVARVRALMARAVDPGASEEEQRTSAHIAAKLCREHGLNIGELGGDVVAGEPQGQVTHARAELVINGVRTVVEAISNAGGREAFRDVFGFAQELLRARAKEAIAETLKKPAPKKRRKRARGR